MNTEAECSNPYEGLLVVSMEQAVAAPLCSRHFSDGGARVIKLERAEGDFARKYDNVIEGESSYFVWANYGKESLIIDFKDPNDADLLHCILKEADVFIQNLKPGTLSRAGFDSAELREKYPRLITCDISGYGDQGPYKDMKAYDFLVQCESGLIAINGSDKGYGRIGVSICDIGASMNAIIGIQQALIRRDKCGKGAGVKVSLFDTAANWMNVPYMHHVYGGKAPQRVGLHHPSIAPYGGYETSDNQVIAISIQNEREWERFCNHVLKKPSLANMPAYKTPNARVKNRASLNGYIDGVFSRLSRIDLEELLLKSSIAYGVMNSVDSFSKHTQLRSQIIDLADGVKVKIIASPIQSSYEQKDKDCPLVPKLGEHNKRLRDEFEL